MLKDPLVISGPSGSGKNFLVDRLVEQYSFQLVLSSMTRLPRGNERHMVDGEFLTDQEFDQAIEDDFFQVNQFLDQRYGYRRSFVESAWSNGKIPAIIYFAPIISQIFDAYPTSYGVFLLPDSLELLEYRMRQRGDSESDIVKRLASAKIEIAAYYKYAAMFDFTAHIAADDDIDHVIAAIAHYYKLD